MTDKIVQIQWHEYGGSGRGSVPCLIGRQVGHQVDSAIPLCVSLGPELEVEVSRSHVGTLDVTGRVTVTGPRRVIWLAARRRGQHDHSSRVTDVAHLPDYLHWYHTVVRRPQRLRAQCRDQRRWDCVPHDD